MTKRVRISFAAHLKRMPAVGFTNYLKNSAKSPPTMYHYRKPRLIKGSRAWYVEYYYRIPVEVRQFYDNKEWYRFRLTEDINRRRGLERENYAVWLLEEITAALKSGYNPFNPEMEYIQANQSEQIIDQVITAKQALQMFLEKWSQRGLDKRSYSKYERYVTRLILWLDRHKILLNDIKTINTDHIESFLNDTKKELKYSNREYNNTFDFIRTAFNFMLKKDIIKKSPCAGIDKLKAKTNKHRYYDKDNLEAITKALLVSDAYCYLACQTVYYLCVRSDKELMNLKVGNINWEQNKVLAEADGTKTKSARYIPLDQNIKNLFLQHGIDKFPDDYYVFGIKGTPALQKFGTGFFAKRFLKVRKAAGLPEHFSVYGFKHTRVIHLKQDGATDADIMSLTGHKDFVAYAKYLRDLGLDADAAKISKLSRKI